MSVDLTPPGRPELPPLDAYGFSLDTREWYDDEFVDRWLGLCRTLFAERYADYPASQQIEGPVWPGIFDALPIGPRLTILRMPPEQQYGTIRIPESAQDENRTVGWVCTVSPELVHNDQIRFPFQHPLDAVGRLVMFPMYAPIQLKSSLLDKQFGGAYVQIQAGDILQRIHRLL